MITLDDFLEDGEPSMTEEACETRMRLFNESYRAGKPTISDEEYDSLMAKYAALFPENSFFNQLEIEEEPELVAGKTVKLPQRMLSTNKAYSLKEIEKWSADVVSIGKSFGLHEEHIFFRVTPKLDGFAGFKQENSLFTRGNGFSGTDISHAFKNGLTCTTAGFSSNVDGAGEIVVKKEYFKEFLAEDYENSRNVIASVIKEEVDPKIKEALKTQNIVFYPFKNLTGWLKTRKQLIEDLETMWEENLNNCQFDTDGLVIETTDWKIKEEMGDTNHHHKWMIAYKKNLVFKEVKVTGIEWNTARVGRITPVVLLEPTEILGVTVSRCSGHNAGLLIQKGINTGAIVKLTRSGLVIPWISEVLVKSNVVSMPGECPSCGSDTQLVNDHLMCYNKRCFAQIEGLVEHWFKNLGVDGFGPKIVERLCNWGYDNIVDIYQMHQQDFYNVIGGKVAENLYNAVKSSMKKEVEDWRLLGSFALDGIGDSMCEKLLQNHKLEDIFNLTIVDVQKINGFGSTNSSNLINSLKRIKDDFECLMDMGFNIKYTEIGGSKLENKIAGNVFVITGTLNSCNRNDMIRKIKTMGGAVGSSVSTKTTYLVTGDNTGATKINAAKKLGTKIILEDEFLEMFN
ncbi:MAG: helix-hairpin-helix domain-containing protein [Bacilli bacterium]|nr:helix-hairpin-helix domain-containing protein [Bacilli bacterium]